MKFTNKYNLASNINLSANILGKGLELLKSKLFNNKEEKGAVNGNSVMEWSLSGEMTLDVSVDELVELYKEYGNDFERQVKFLKEELRPCVKEVMAVINDSAESFQKTLHECEDRELIHEEKAANEKKSKKSE